MIPTARLAWLVALGVPMLLLGVVSAVGTVLAATWNTILIGATILDLVRTADPRRLRVERNVPSRAVQGRPERIEVRVANPGARTARIAVRDVAPGSLRRREAVRTAIVPPRSSARLDYDVLPTVRGPQSFRWIAVRSEGPLGLVRRQTRLDRPARTDVYPDLVRLPAREAALAHPSATRQGSRLARHQGEGREFHQLRDYVAGDDVRFLDWKAFAHRGRPIVREYQLERNQRVLVLIDGGRMMTVRVGDRLRFDWAVQAAGRLARAALALGDRVGVAVFSRDVRAHVPSASGRGHLGALADLLAHANADLEEPDLGLALRTLLRRNVRRTLVVVFTELSDPRAARAALRHLGRLAPRHLGLVVTLADTDLQVERDRPPDRPIDVYRRVAAEELWQDRARTGAALRSRGAMVVEAHADALAAETVERYLEIKRRGRL